MNGDEVSENAEQLFIRLIKTTKCPFATKAQIGYGSVWRNGVDLTDMVPIWADEIGTFVATAHDSKLDGFILSGYGEHVPCNLEALAQFVRVVLFGLIKLDRGTEITSAEVEGLGWQFTFGGVRMFLATFASFYDVNNARHSPVSNSVFLFLQPELSFDRFMPYSEHDPRTQQLKAAIRSGFARAGVSYDQKIVESSSETLKYVKPLNLGDPSVEWWKY